MPTAGLLALILGIALIMAVRTPHRRQGDKYAGDARTWFLWAEASYSGAHKLFHSGDALLLFPAAILGHHALEMYLKAALIKLGHKVGGDIWGHRLRSLAARIAKEVPEFPKEIRAGLKVFDDYFAELRYPGEVRKVEGLGEAEADLLDELVNKLRPYAQPPTDRS